LDYLKILNVETTRYNIIFTEGGAIHNEKNLGFVFNVKATKPDIVAFTPNGMWRIEGNSISFTRCPGLIDCSSDGCAYLTKEGILVVPQNEEPYTVEPRPLFLIPYELPVPFFGQLWGSKFVTYKIYPDEKEVPLSDLYKPHRLFKALPTLFPYSFSNYKGIRSAKIGGVLTDNGLVISNSLIKANGEFIDFARVDNGILLYGNEQKLVNVDAIVEEPIDEPVVPDRRYCQSASDIKMILNLILYIIKSAVKENEQFVKAFAIGFSLALGMGLAQKLLSIGKK